MYWMNKILIKGTVTVTVAWSAKDDSSVSSTSRRSVKRAREETHADGSRYGSLVQPDGCRRELRDDDRRGSRRLPRTGDEGENDEQPGSEEHRVRLGREMKTNTGLVWRSEGRGDLDREAAGYKSTGGGGVGGCFQSSNDGRGQGERDAN